MNADSEPLLLSTRLKIPVPRKNYIIRKKLFEELLKCKEMGVTYVHGGAGTGKTTLLSSFIRETALKNVSWLSMDNANSNVYSFWLYFMAAISTFSKIGNDYLNLARSNSDISQIENQLIRLINQLCGEEEYYMVLDDVHYIRDEVLIKTLEYFMRAMPANFHLIMLSRESPPVYLGPLAVSGRLLFLNAKQMQLTKEEGREFLKKTLEFSGDLEEMNQLNTFAEGWIAGLQLAVASRKDSLYLLKTGGGIAAEYLTREVFEFLSEKEKDFLISTGVLSYFDYEICVAFYPEYTKMDFEQLIEDFIQKNLFIICIDDEKGVYRYHNILSQYLIQQFLKFPEEKKINFYKQAGFVFEKLGDAQEALRQFCDAKDYENVMRVAKQMEGRMEAWNYLVQVPLDQLVTDADLTAQCFMYYFSTMNFEQCQVMYHKFMSQYGESKLIYLLQFAEGFISDGKLIFSQREILKREQLEELTFHDVAKAMVALGNAVALLDLCRYEESEEYVKWAIKCNSGKNVLVTYYAYNQLAQIYEEVGKLNDSLSCYEKIRKLLQMPTMITQAESNYYFGLCGVHMRRMELTKAEKNLVAVSQLLKKHRIQTILSDVTVAFHEIELKILQSKKNEAVKGMEIILTDYPAISRLNLSRLIYEMECIHVLSDEIANEFLREYENSGEYGKHPFLRLLYARLLLRQGNVKDALTEINEILTYSRMHKNKLHIIESGICKIYLLTHYKDIHRGKLEIKNLFYEVIHYACEERILMPFYLDRSVLFPLFGETLSLTSKEAFFLQDVIRISGESGKACKEIENLSPRELEVLAELSLGITNREIAKKLYISQATVKTHVLSIFGKLGVSSRMLAVEKGREKGLL